MSCNKCRGTCRCEHRYALCSVAEQVSLVTVPCPTDWRGCAVEDIECSKLEIYCKCCPIKILEFENPLDIDRCDGCYLILDMTELDTKLLAGMTLADLRATCCDFKYKFTINNMLYLSGVFTFDMSAV